MEYSYNKETDGICTIYEFMRNGCEKCPKRGKCDEVVQAHYEELKANDKVYHPTTPNNEEKLTTDHQKQIHRETVNNTK